MQWAVSKAKSRSSPARGDVGKRGEVEALFGAARNAFGSVDILITNAGVVRESAICDIADEDWDAQLRTMLGGTFLCTQLFVRQAKHRAAGGRVLMVSSQLALQGAANVAAYCAAKGAICAFGLTAAQELAALGITVNILSPMAYTRLTAGLPLMVVPNAEELMSPDFCADVSAFLVSDALLTSTEAPLVFLASINSEKDPIASSLSSAWRGASPSSPNSPNV